MKIIISKKQQSLIEQSIGEIHPCFEKTMKFYQSKEGQELMSLLREHMEKKNLDPKYKMDREKKKRLKYLVRLTPKC